MSKGKRIPWTLGAWLVLIFCAASVSGFPQQVAISNAHLVCPFEPGEVARYEIRYGVLKGGDITLRVENGPGSAGVKPWHFVGRAVSSKLVSVFYRVDDAIEGWVAPRTFLPQRLKMRVVESGERGTREVIYDQGEGVAHYTRNRVYHRKRGPSVLDRDDELNPQAQDALSFLYFLRCLDLKPGEERVIALHENGKNRLARVKVGEVEEVATPLGPRAATPLEVDVTVEGKLANRRALRVWLGEGPQRWPMRFEADLKFGKLKGLLAAHRATEDGEAAGQVEIVR